MRREAKKELPFGLYPKEVEVTFNLSASAEANSGLKVDLSAPTGSPVTAAVSGSTSLKSTAARGNQITIKFSNIMDAHPTNTLLGQKGSNVTELIKHLQNEGLVPTR